MRFAGQPEIYVLYADYGSLGGRVLKYDSGAIAIQVAGWGGMTLYTDDQPQGLPAVRTGDSSFPNLGQVTLAQVAECRRDEAAHLAYVRGVHVTFFDRLERAGRRFRHAGPDLRLPWKTRRAAFDRFTANPAARAAFAQRVNAVQLVTSAKPIIQMQGKPCS